MVTGNLQIGLHNWTIALPYLDFPSGNILYKHFTWNPVFSYPGAGENNGEIFFSEMAQLLGQNPVWNYTTDPALALPAEQSAGVQIYSLTNLIGVDSTIIVEGVQTDRNWLPSDYGKYAVVRGIANGKPGPLHYVNSTQHTMWFLPGQYQQIEVTVMPGVTWKGNLKFWAGIPPLYISVDGGAFNKVATGWPWFASFDPPP